MYKRNQGEHFGIIPLNIYGFKNDKQISILIDFLKDIFPYIKILEISISNLENLKTKLLPVKNYSTLEIDNSEYQVSLNTIILCDESKLAAGQMNERGLVNLSFIDNILCRQEMPIEFFKNVIFFPTNSPIIIFSQYRSIFKGSWAYQINGVDVKETEINENLKMKFRQYLLILKTETLNIELGKD